MEMHGWAWAQQKVEKKKKEKIIEAACFFTGHKFCWYIINKNFRFLTLTKILSAELCFELFYASKLDGNLKLYCKARECKRFYSQNYAENKTNFVTPIIILSENFRASLSLCAFYVSSSIFLYPTVVITLTFFFICSFAVV